MNDEVETKLRSVIETIPPSHFKTQIELLLKNEKQNSLEALLNILGDSKREVDLRITIAWILGQLQVTEVVEGMLELFDQEQSVVAWEIAKSLVIIRDARVIEPFINNLLKNQNLEKRITAAYALGALADKKALPALLGVLKDKHEDARLRGQVAEALAQIDTNEKIIPLIEALNDPSAEVRFWTAFALGESKDKQAIPYLQKLADEDKEYLPDWGLVSEEALKAIETINQDKIN